MKRRTAPRALLASILILVMALPVRAWNPPIGSALDLAFVPESPTTLLHQAHSYVTQNAISVLYNDGYWFAAQTLREWQHELLNGVKYADHGRGKGTVTLELCFFFTAYCETLAFERFNIAATAHFFNPDTKQGLDMGFWNEFRYLLLGLQWVIIYLTLGLAFLNLDLNPGSVSDVYPSALEVFDEAYSNALSAAGDGAAASIGGRTDTALAMFYLGWASHFVQDLNVVHHTFDAFFPWTGHQDYENAADGLGERFAPVPGQSSGIYEEELPTSIPDCVQGSRTCFVAFAAHASHDPDVLEAVTNSNFTSIQFAIPRAQNLQAGLFAAFLTDVGLQPVHMSAIIATF